MFAVAHEFIREAFKIPTITPVWVFEISSATSVRGVILHLFPRSATSSLPRSSTSTIPFPLRPFSSLRPAVILFNNENPVWTPLPLPWLCKDEKVENGSVRDKERSRGRERKRERERQSRGTCSGTSGNFLMSENVADIRPTALGKWDERLIKNTIEFCLSVVPLPKRGEKRRKS